MEVQGEVLEEGEEQEVLEPEEREGGYAAEEVEEGEGPSRSVSTRSNPNPNRNPNPNPNRNP